MSNTIRANSAREVTVHRNKSRNLRASEVRAIERMLAEAASTNLDVMPATWMELA